MFGAIRADLRHGFRLLRRDARLAGFSILIVGLGIGVSCTVFNVVNALLLRPLPFEDPSRLVWIANGTSADLPTQTVRVATLQELRAQSRTLDGVAGYSPFYGAGNTRLTGAGEAERLTAVPVTGDFFPLLGVQPKTGRLFTADECRWGAPKTALLSHRLAVLGHVIASEAVLVHDG